MSNATIFIVDDDRLVLDLGRAVFQSAGCSVFTSHNWVELNAQMHDHQPDLILLDINMPSLPGDRLAQILRAQHGDALSVVLMSDLPEATIASRARDAGASGWLRKPLTMQKVAPFLATVRPAQDSQVDPAAAPLPEQRTVRHYTRHQLVPALEGSLGAAAVRCLNLSGRGALVTHEHPVRTRTATFVLRAANNVLFATTARVVWSRLASANVGPARYETGLELLENTETIAAALNTLIRTGRTTPARGSAGERRRSRKN